MQRIEMAVTTNSYLLIECVDIIKNHLDIRKIPNNPSLQISLALSVDDLPSAMRLAILSFRTLTVGECFGRLPSNSVVHSMVQENWPAISAWMQWLCNNCILIEPQTTYMLYNQSKMLGSMCHSMRILFRIGARSQITSTPSLIAIFWKIWLSEPSIGRDMEQLSRMTILPAASSGPFVLETGEDTFSEMIAQAEAFNPPDMLLYHDHF